MDTLQNNYKKNKLIEKVNKLKIETQELDQVILESWTIDEIKGLERWLDSFRNASRNFNLSSIEDAINDAYDVLVDSQLTASKDQKITDGWVDDMSDVSSLIASVFAFFQKFPNMLDTLWKSFDITDDFKKVPLKDAFEQGIASRATGSKERSDKFVKMVKSNFVVPNKFTWSGRASSVPFMDDKIDDLVAELQELSFEQLMNIANSPAVDSRPPIDADDVDALKNAQDDPGSAVITPSEEESEGSEESDEKLSTPTEKEADPTDELEKISDLDIPLKSAISQALNTWTKSHPLIQKEFSPDGVHLPNIKRRINKAIDSSAETMAKTVQDAIEDYILNKGLLDDEGNENSVPEGTFEKLVNVISQEVVQSIQKQTSESKGRFEISLKTIQNITYKHMDRVFNRIL